MLTTELGHFKVSFRVVDSWYNEKSRETTGDDAPSVAAEVLELKRSSRDVEAGLREEFSGKDTGENTSQPQQETLASWSCQYHGKTAVNRS